MHAARALLQDSPSGSVRIQPFYFHRLRHSLHPMEIRNPFLCHTSTTPSRKSFGWHTYEPPGVGKFHNSPVLRSAFCFLPCLFARVTMPVLEFTRVGNCSPRRGCGSRSRL